MLSCVWRIGVVYHHDDRHGKVDAESVDVAEPKEPHDRQYITRRKPPTALAMKQPMLSAQQQFPLALAIGVHSRLHEYTESRRGLICVR